MENQAPNFSLLNENGETVTLAETLKKGPVLIVFYPGDFTPVCTAQLCNYRDSMSEFTQYGVQILGLSHNDVASHLKFKKQYNIPFPLLTDPKNETARAFGCTSKLMFGGVSRGVFLVSEKNEVVYKHVEVTPLTRRDSKDLLDVIASLKKQKTV